MLTDILLFSGLLLIGLKFGLGARLREIGRVFDRLINILLGLIIGGYALQVIYLFLKK